jgi:phosphoribosylformylglycinamidine cyclo-ligase
VLVSGTDGVGTKLMLAFATGHHDTIGIDLVAMCANDVLAQGAEPLFFLDYFATGELDAGVAEAVIAGIAEGCRRAGCALIGGETAEMPGMYAPGHYDLAGFVVGAVERDSILPRHSDMVADDVLIALPATGPHSNGYSLIRKVVERTGLGWDVPAPFAEETLLGEALLTPTGLYARPLMPLLKAGLIKGVAHITGGGLPGNVPRMLPEGLRAGIDATSWSRPAVFDWLQREGRISEADMQATFNLGVGMVCAVAAEEADGVLDALAGSGAWAIGTLVGTRA